MVRINMVEPNWISQKPNLIYKNFRSLEHFLGYEDADVEWTKGGSPEDIFLHTNSYRDFKNRDCLFVFGQRGSGKTAMMKMLSHEITYKRVSEYGFAWIINQEDAYHNLSIHLRNNKFTGLTKDELIHILTKEWEWIFNISAMASVVKARVQEDRENRDISTIIRFLREKKLLDDDTFRFKKNFLLRLMESVIEEFKRDDLPSPVKLGINVLNLINKLLFTAEYEVALSALSRILRHSHMTCLIMVDSKEKYTLNDEIEQAVVTALVESTRDFHIHEPENHILVKVAFPSEFSSRIEIPNAEKTMSNIMYISWTYRDIVCFIAKRYWRSINKTWNKQSLERLNDFDVARHFLYRHFPDKIAYGNNMYFDTMAYIIRHTHKKPRQVIFLLNIILNIANEEKNDILNISDAQIINGIHSNLEDLTNGCLNMYNQIYKNADFIVKRGLKGINSYFDYSSLDKRLNEVHSIRAESNLSLNDVKRLLFASGVLGIQQSRCDLPEYEVAIVEAIFEYQIKDTITLTNEDIIVVHPMFYEPLQIRVDVNTFVYPKPAENEEVKIIQDIGIRNNQ